MLQGRVLGLTPPRHVLLGERLRSGESSHARGTPGPGTWRSGVGEEPSLLNQRRVTVFMTSPVCPMVSHVSLQALHKSPDTEQSQRTSQSAVQMDIREWRGPW